MLKLTVFSSLVIYFFYLKSHLLKQSICNTMTRLCGCFLLLKFSKFLSILDHTVSSLSSTLAETSGFLHGKPHQDVWSQRKITIVFLLGVFSAGSVPWITHWIDSEMAVAVERAEKAGVGTNGCQWKMRQAASFI